MKKKVLCLAMALVMLAGGSLTAHAEELKGQDGWRAEFNGKKIVSNFDSGTLADEAGNVQPGDSITLKVEIKNSDTGSTDWYMTNEAIQSLEDAAMWPKAALTPTAWLTRVRRVRRLRFTTAKMWAARAPQESWRDSIRPRTP